MNSVVRVSSLSLPVSLLNPLKCVPSLLEAVQKAAKLSSDIIVLPTLSLSGASGGSMLLNRALLSLCDEALRTVAEATKEINAYLIVGLPAVLHGQVVSACAVMNHGRVLDIVPDAGAPEGLIPPPVLGSDLDDGPVCKTPLYNCGDICFCVAPNRPQNLALFAACAVQQGADLILCPSNIPVHAGSVGRCRSIARAISSSLGCAVALSNGGLGETSFPEIRKAFCGVFECGEELAFLESREEPVLVTADIDADVIRANKARGDAPGSFAVGLLTPNEKSQLFRPVSKNPFLPSDFSEAEDVLSELFSLQADALVTRMRNIGCKSLVLGVSGGVDSTLALLVCAKALDRLSLPRHNLIGITMPGFGTSDRTYYNAIEIIDRIGAARREISIKESVLQHFADISHDPAVHDVTYENAQARERTQILFDIANTERGLVVGTGDLSEAALGWCTFGGDHIASFNVNAAVTKNVARELIRRQAGTKDFSHLSTYLLDVLDTPISPELLPASASGKIQQKTEDILGPYELHEFFLYYFVRYRMAPSKILRYALCAFSADYEKELIVSTLKAFIRRFFGGQFKRSCAPDSAALTDISLNSAFFNMPSDGSPDAMLSELDRYVSTLF